MNIPRSLLDYVSSDERLTHCGEATEEMYIEQIYRIAPRFVPGYCGIRALRNTTSSRLHPLYYGPQHLVVYVLNSYKVWGIQTGSVLE
jgi:hypothetical protein